MLIRNAYLAQRAITGGGVPSYALRTGLALYSDNDVAHPAQFEAFADRPADIQLVFFNQSSWANFDSSIDFITNLWADTTCIWSVPLSAEYDIANVASGVHDTRFANCAAKILAAAPDDELIWVRTGWEMNLLSQPQRAFDVATPPNPIPATWVTAYQRVVNIFRGLSSRFRFIWCPNASEGVYEGLTVLDTWPGPTYVDLVGLDMYFDTLYDSTADQGLATWNYKNGLTWGPANTAAFAAAQGKPFGMIEYGIDNNTVVKYATEQYKLIRDPDTNCVIHGLWDSDAAIATEISNGNLPAIGALYKQYFGPPVILTASTGDSAQNVDVDIPLTSNQDAIDGVTVTWSIVSGTGTIIGGTTLRIAGAPAGDVVVTVRATNSDGYHGDDLVRTQTFKAPHVFVNAEAAAYVADLPNQPTESQKAYLDTFWTAVKAGDGANLLPKTDQFGFGFIDSGAAVLNAKSRAYGTVVPVNGPTYVAGQGYQGNFDGVTAKYLNMGITFSRSGNVYVNNSACLAAWEFGNIATDSGILGNDNVGNRLAPKTGAGAFTGKLNGFGTAASVATTEPRGFSAVNRSGASAEQLYKNGIAVATGTGASGGVGSGQTLYGLSTNTGFPAGHILGAWWMGSSLTANEHKVLYNAFRNLMVSWGVIVAADYPVAT